MSTGLQVFDFYAERARVVLRDVIRVANISALFALRKFRKLNFLKRKLNRSVFEREARAFSREVSFTKRHEVLYSSGLRPAGTYPPPGALKYSFRMVNSSEDRLTITADFR